MNQTAVKQNSDLTTRIDRQTDKKRPCKRKRKKIERGGVREEERGGAGGKKGGWVVGERGGRERDGVGGERGSGGERVWGSGGEKGREGMRQRDGWWYVESTALKNKGESRHEAVAKKDTRTATIVAGCLADKWG